MGGRGLSSSDLRGMPRMCAASFWCMLFHFPTLCWIPLVAGELRIRTSLPPWVCSSAVCFQPMFGEHK